MLGFAQAEQDAIISLVSSVLHIGNIAFRSTGDRSCEVVAAAGANRADALASAAKLMQVRAMHSDCSASLVIVALVVPILGHSVRLALTAVTRNSPGSHLCTNARHQ